MTSTPQPFTLDVPDAALADLRERLARTRFPDQAPGEAWAYGTDGDYLRGLVDYWRSGFDWRREEARLNGFPQFRVRLHGIELHYLHVEGRGPDPCPLLLSHGWPGSVIEQLKIIEPLTNPTAHGGRAADAFHVVIPSMPGYGFSGKPAATGWGPQRIASAWVGAMARVKRPSGIFAPNRASGQAASQTTIPTAETITT